MNKIIYTAFFIFLLSCSGGHDLGEYEHIHFVKDVDAEITDYEVIDWKAGEKRKNILSKGISINLNLIELSTEAKEILSKKYAVDSWIYRVLRVSDLGKKEQLGFAKISFDRISSKFRKLTFIVYYSSAYISREFRSFKCPAFNHRKLISEIKLLDSGKVTEKLFVARKNNSNIGTLESTFPISFNGGTSLEGNYIVEMALYSSSNKQVYSDWAQLQNVVQIQNEKSILVKSCNGVKEENNPREENEGFNIKNLQIK